MRFADFIKNNMEAILKEWDEHARSLPPAKSMDAAKLRDHAGEILKTIAEDMIVTQSEAEQESRSKGTGRLMKLSLEFAEKHAGVRYDDGFDINQVVGEYRALRASVIRLWTRQEKEADAGSLYELTRFNEEIDQALTYAIQEFVAIAERSREEFVRKLQKSEERYRSSVESLQQANKNKNEFLAILAHELRNPLAPLQTGVEVLRLMEGMPAAAESPLCMMERQTAHLVRLVGDLLDVSRINRGAVSLRLEKVNIVDVIRSTVEAAASYIDVGKRNISLKLPSEPLIVKGDPVRLTQVLGNLLSNAGKHTDENGHIGISAEREGQQVKIVVRDDGAGIAPDKLGDLFEMFRQLDVVPKEGLGIGLAVARKLVELHGGSIIGSSEGLGRGSEFAIYLSIVHEELQTNAPEKENRNIEFGVSRVLIVDDNRDAAESLNMLLQLQGATCCLAYDGPSALAKLEEFRPNLVLLDIGLPGMDGYEVAGRIREKEEGRDVKIVAVSGWGQDEDRLRDSLARIDKHLIKPVNLQDIERLMDDLSLNP